MKTILNDLIAEQAQVDVLVADLTEEEWLTPLPGVGMWNIKDAVAQCIKKAGKAKSKINPALAQK